MVLQGTIKKLGSMSPAEITMRRKFISFQIFKRGHKKIIVGTTSPALFQLESPFIEVIELKRTTAERMMQGIRRPDPRQVRRNMISPRDMPFKGEKVEKLNLVVGTERDYNTKMDVYLLNG